MNLHPTLVLHALTHPHVNLFPDGEKLPFFFNGQHPLFQLVLKAFDPSPSGPVVVVAHGQTTTRTTRKSLGCAGELKR